MTSDARGHRGTGAQSGRTVEAALAAAIVFALAAGPAAAQRLPERFGLPAAVRWTPAGPRAALVQDTLRQRRVSGAEVALGIAGSAAGMWGGAFAGLLVYDAHSSCSPFCDDAGLGAGVIGLTVGSIVGTAVGTRLGAKLAHRRPGSFGRRLVAGGAGLLAGLAAFELASNLTGHDYNAPPLIAFPVAQGFVGALLGRAR